MGVARRAAVSREVFQTAHHALLRLAVEPGGTAVGDLRCVGREAATQPADDRAVGVDVDIGAGGEVEVDAQVAEHGSGTAGMVTHRVDAALGHLLGRRRGDGEAVAHLETRHTSALLVDADP